MRCPEGKDMWNYTTFKIGLIGIIWNYMEFFVNYLELLLELFGITFGIIGIIWNYL
jgi:hypothetical protein